jgi:hypothetical protein
MMVRLERKEDPARGECFARGLQRRADFCRMMALVRNHRSAMKRADPFETPSRSEEGAQGAGNEFRWQAKGAAGRIGCDGIRNIVEAVEAEADADMIRRNAEAHRNG